MDKEVEDERRCLHPESGGRRGLPSSRSMDSLSLTRDGFIADPPIAIVLASEERLRLRLRLRRRPIAIALATRYSVDEPDLPPLMLCLHLPPPPSSSQICAIPGLVSLPILCGMVWQSHRPPLDLSLTLKWCTDMEAQPRLA